MFYYQAPIKVVDGKKVFGDLPENYTVGYENEVTNTVYFPLLQKLDERYIEVTEISKEVYEQQIAEISRITNEKRQSEFEETRGKIQEKENRIVQLESEKEALKLDNQMLMMSVMELTTLTAQQEELNKTNEQAIMELSMMVSTGGM